MQGSSQRALYALAIFLGSFLLFAIQPIAGKHVLPFFGGSSSVWATSLLFFTSTLFLGYLYVFLLTKAPRTIQMYVHGGAIALAALFIAWSFFSGPYSAAIGVDASNPSLGVLLVLVLSIGAPYFLLATTGPLLQYWYGISQKREPYALYALSNVGSLLALLSYPFLIEPIFSLRMQDQAWSLLFLLYVALYAIVAFLFFRAFTADARIHDAASTPLRRALLWIALAALPAFLLVSTTTQITQVVAPVPFLWTVPLALYLVSFILAFRGWGGSIYVPLLLLGAAVFAYTKISASYAELSLQLIAHLLLLFLTGLYCHAQLYRSRPETERLPFFYLQIAFGGAVGCLAATLLPPLLFPDFWEFTLGLALVGAVATVALPIAFFPRIFDERMVVGVKAGVLLSILMLTLQFFSDETEIAQLSTRNFYGNARVVFAEGSVRLMHGTTLHGLQLSSREDSYLPTTYYTPSSGVGRAIRFEESTFPTRFMRIGVVGLGTGTLAAYCRPSDAYVFYEIDPRIVSIATSYFSYVPRCKGATVRVGDGRILLEEERARGERGEYDVLAIDAFSDDTIPIHLLTQEAFDTYVAHLRGPKSILAVHVSNRYLVLAPVVLRLAAELGLNAMVVQASGDADVGGSGSEWVLLARDAEVFRSVTFANANSSPPEGNGPLWRDDYSALFPVLNIPKPWE